MPPEPNELTRILEAVESLKREVAALSDRLAAVEAAQTETQDPTISEELILSISAAIAAYLGKRARIRQIRLLGSAAWAQQGRVTVQASHRLST